jgi:hypothetical protein
MTKSLLFVHLCIVGDVLLTGCTGPGSAGPIDANEVHRETSNYEKAIQSGVQSSFYPGQFNKLFPQCSNRISYYTSRGGAKTWYSKVGLHGRYFLKLMVPVELADSSTKVVNVGQPEFQFFRSKSIDILPDGRFSIAADTNQYLRFGPEAWEKLVAAKGDLNVLGIQVETNAPLKNFDAAWPTLP